MSRKRRRQQPSLDSVQIKIDRARFHSDCLVQKFRSLVEGGTDTFTPEIKRDGLEHVYRAKNPPYVTDWSPIIGDCLHNLRSALDHLAYQLARNPNTHTSFPIHSNPPRGPWYRGHKVRLPNISGGIENDVRRILDAVQPYNRRDLNRGLDLLRDLDDIDKHRIILVAVAVNKNALGTYWGPLEETPQGHFVFPGKALKHHEVFAVVKYTRPQPEPDPNLKFLPHVAFDRARSIPNSIRGDEVTGVLNDLAILVENDVLPRFKRFVS